MPRLPTAEDLGQRPSRRVNAAQPRRADYSEAEGLQMLSQAVEGFGEAYQRVKKHDDTLQAEAAYNKLLEQRMLLTNEMMEIKGEDAIKRPILQEYSGKLLQASLDIEDNLINDDQREMYHRRAEVAKMQHTNDIMRHISRERAEYEKAEFSATLTLEAREASNRYLDDNAIKMSATRVDGVIKARADKEGWSPEQTEAVQREAMSNIYEGAINQSIAMLDPDRANALFTEHKEDLLPDKRAELKKRIENASIENTIQQVADDVQARGISEYEALKEVEKKYSGEQEKKIKEGVKARYAETQAAAADEGWRIFNKTGKVEDIPSHIWDDMGGKEQRLIKNKAESPETLKPGQGDYYVLRELYQKDPVAFQGLDLNRYRLAPGDFKELVKIQTDDMEYDSALTRDQIIKSTIRALGGDPKNIGKPGNIATELQQRIDIEIRQDSAAQGGKKLTRAQIQSVSDRLTIDVIRKRPILWDLAIPAGKIKIKDVPPEFTDDVAQLLQQSGRPVTEANVAVLYSDLSKRIEKYNPPVTPQKLRDLYQFMQKGRSVEGAISE